EHPLREASKTAGSIRAGLLAFASPLPANAFTVARPRGIHTRFPILLALMRGTRTLVKNQKSKSFLMLTDDITWFRQVSNHLEMTQPEEILLRDKYHSATTRN